MTSAHWSIARLTTEHPVGIACIAAVVVGLLLGTQLNRAIRSGAVFVGKLLLIALAVWVGIAIWNEFGSTTGHEASDPSVSPPQSSSLTEDWLQHE